MDDRELLDIINGLTNKQKLDLSQRQIKVIPSQIGNIVDLE